MEIAAGIELGHTYCKLAHTVSPGSARVLTNRSNARQTPTAVAFDSGGDTIVGEAALKFPDCVSGDLLFRIARGESIKIGKRKLSPQDLAVSLLTSLMADLTDRIGQTPTTVTIAVPSAWDDVPRGVVQSAAKGLGIEASIVMSAVAAAYSSPRLLETPNLLVCDIGGLEFTATQLSIDSDGYSVVDSRAVAIGGSSFDRRLVDWALALIVADTGVDASSDSPFLADLTSVCEKARIYLQRARHADIVMPASLRSPAGGLLDVLLLIERDEFERMIEDDVIAMMEVARSIKRGDIDAALLVGGAAQTPFIQDHARRTFGKVVVDGEAADRAVLGAAILASKPVPARPYVLAASPVFVEPIAEPPSQSPEPAVAQQPEVEISMPLPSEHGAVPSPDITYFPSSPPSSPQSEEAPTPTDNVAAGNEADAAPQAPDEPASPVNEISAAKAEDPLAPPPPNVSEPEEPIVDAITADVSKVAAPVAHDNAGAESAAASAEIPEAEAPAGSAIQAEADENSAPPTPTASETPAVLAFVNEPDPELLPAEPIAAADPFEEPIVPAVQTAATADTPETVADLADIIDPSIATSDEVVEPDLAGQQAAIADTPIEPEPEAEVEPIALIQEIRSESTDDSPIVEAQQAAEAEAAWTPFVMEEVVPNAEPASERESPAELQPVAAVGAVLSDGNAGDDGQYGTDYEPPVFTYPPDDAPSAPGRPIDLPFAGNGAPVDAIVVVTDEPIGDADFDGDKSVDSQDESDFEPVDDDLKLTWEIVPVEASEFVCSEKAFVRLVTPAYCLATHGVLSENLGFDQTHIYSAGPFARELTFELDTNRGMLWELTVELPESIEAGARVDISGAINVVSGAPFLTLAWDDTESGARRSVTTQAWTKVVELELDIPVDELESEEPLRLEDIFPAVEKSTPVEEETGTWLGKYRVVESLDRTAMHETLHVRSADGADYVARMYDGDERATRSFLNGLLALQVESAYVQRVCDFGMLGTSRYIISQGVEYHTLRDVLAASTDRRLSVERSIEIAANLCSGLQALHDQKIIHRNIKPSHVRIDLATGDALLADFEIAASLRGREFVSDVAGTMPYMAAEVLDKRSDTRSDIYALGVLLYEMLTGRLPFWSSNQRLLTEMIRSERPTPPSELKLGIEAGLSEVVMCALNRDASLRFESASEFRDALLQAQGDPELTMTSHYGS